ncbi:MAG: DNA-binding protein WhiA [Clostridia bacterium]|nr:DNA-binding protein WhiA [Clostridia bacterium]
MSFSENVKTELACQVPKKTCCRKAFVFGLLINSFPSEEGLIAFESEHDDVYSSAFNAIKEQFGKEPFKSERKRFGHIRKVLSFSSRSASEIFGKLEEAEAFSDVIGFRCDDCRAYFMRGVFLSSASVSDPMKSYHLEFTVKDAKRAKLLFSELREIGFEAKIANRRTGVGLYFKESEAIEDILTYLGASKMLFECMNDKIVREIRNDSNRRANCEAGNIAKSVSASQEIIAAIRKIENAGLLPALPNDLRETARLRAENPEASLSEICGMFLPPLSKSGLSHRFAKIKKFAEDIGEK